RATQTRRIARNELVCGRGSHRDCRPADDCAAHARASPLQDGSSRVSLSCRWTEASTKSETFCPVVEAGSPAQSTRPCSGAANQCDPCAHGFRDWTPWQGGAEIRSLVPIGAPKMAVGNYVSKISTEIISMSVWSNPDLSSSSMGVSGSTETDTIVESAAQGYTNRLILPQAIAFIDK